MKLKSLPLIVWTALALLVVAAAAVWLAHAYSPDSFVERKAPEPLGSGKTGVVFHDKFRAWQGVNLYNPYVSRGLCQLMDMNGELERNLPGMFCRFLPDGRFYTFIGGLSVLALIDGQDVVWKSEPLRVHHDVNVDPNDLSVYAVVTDVQKYRGKEAVFDGITGFDIKGKKIFEWRAFDHIADWNEMVGEDVEPKWNDGVKAFLFNHLNSVQVLGPNRLAKKNPIFKPGNILASCNRFNVIFIIDRETGKIVWTYRSSGDEYDGAHTPRLLKSGNILFFHNNNIGSLSAPERYSRIVEIDPLKLKEVWSYKSDPPGRFFNEMWGSVFELPNQNILITHVTNGGGAFEITREGRIVWDWVNPEVGSAGKPEIVYRLERWSKESVDNALQRFNP